MAEIATIGYAETTPALLLEALRGAEIELLVDVRAIANSRRPGFAKRSLAAGVESVGIGYLHLKGLGTPATGREAARAGRLLELRAIYEEHLGSLPAQHDMEVLADLLTSGRRVCILCLERDPAHCHRSFIATKLQARLGFEVRHLQPAAIGDAPHDNDPRE